MKKQLLLGSALLAAISVYPQLKQRPVSVGNISSQIAAKFAIEPENAVTTLRKSTTPDLSPMESGKSASLPPSTINWNLLTGSQNIYGMLLGESQPLQYNDNLNAVSFIHRKSATYTPNPAVPSSAAAGVIVAMVSTNWGTTFDSTCIWSDVTNWGRYPQGGIYNPSGNTNIANAYVVGTGPTVAGSSFTGNFYASKQLNTFDNVASTAPNAQQFFPFAQTGPVTNHGWSRCGFSSTDDGIVRSAALLQADNTTLAALRGYAIAKGVFNAGAFTWSTDSIIPPALIEPATGDKVLGFAPLMAWNEAGTVGYFATIGTLAGATSQNIGQHPIIYKTTNSGVSWSLLPVIDFNSVAMKPILDHLASTNADTNVTSPFFSDWDITVDANDKLHIGAVMFSHSSIDADSLNYLQQWSNGGELYRWGHTPGNRPYLYDFIGDGSGPWNFVTIDSCSSEQAGAATGSNGFNENPWDPTGTNGSKTNNVDHRIQLGRTPDGQYITYSWVESDTNFTNGSRKYNSLPNIKTRCMSIGTGTNMYIVSPTEINVTKVASGTGTPNTSVANRATLHYMSPVTGSATISGPNVDIYTPLTVTNSNPFSQLTNNTTWYQSGKLSYTFPSGVGVKENAQNSASNSVLYPNPASNNATLAIDLKDNSTVNITVLSTIGQLVKSSNSQGQIGENNINVDLTGLSTGIYLVNIKVGNATSTKKLVVQ
ncbi:MAG: T9SS type A sorting domain-containing protein [Bacteroidota bacterium]|nr:T9SS type A sorting domain-containing protein [Bacteroidota bacterium]MDP3144361.1 T9SS type A sorting domain-containing protein [Bacteroidota bacterium]MDP3557175.1 T9SS type A sorting domain-containing protein [Bacteroidota bacterium]